jgi:hypothetical protein
MITYLTDSKSLLELGQSSHQSYAGNAPFPHIAIDDFFDAGVLESVLAEAAVVDRARTDARFLDRKTDHNKFCYKPETVGTDTARLVNFLNSGPFLAYMEKLTGIPNLLPDPSNFGGGLHWIEKGGFLEVHSDFNHLKKYNLERRINLLLYLNKDWKDEYNGHLELWHDQTSTMARSIAPLFNRCVVFSTTAESLHGHPVPLATPDGVARKSLALYYYTNTWKPAEKSNETIYYISRNNPVKVKLDPVNLVRNFILDLIPPIFRKTARMIRRKIKRQKLNKIVND